MAMWPRPRAPISTTAASVSSGAFSRVSGTPSSLLNERTLAVVTRVVASTEASRSLVVVLPTDPVMPITMASPPRAERSSRVRA